MLNDRLKTALLAIASLGLISGAGLWMAGLPEPAALAWSAGVVPVLAACLMKVPAFVRNKSHRQAF
jgi:predicted PurR-regulated permease PerM